MKRTVGTVARGIRTPIIKSGDNIVNIVVDSVLKSSEAEKYPLRDKDVIGITESLIARAQGNYVTLEDIAFDIKRKFKENIVILFPLLSRNRFSMILKGIAMSGSKIHLVLSYPSDEVGNHLLDVEKMDELGINPCIDVLNESKYRELFGEKVKHPYTQVDYVQEYKDIGEGNIEICLANDPRTALNYGCEILVANVHERHRTKKVLLKSGAKNVICLDEILDESINGSGFNPDFGLLGSNKATDNTIKLFPRECNKIVADIQSKIRNKTGKNIEVLIYGDGAFKDPIGKIWELADPVVSPGYTKGLCGITNEIKLKYIVDNKYESLGKDQIDEAIKRTIKEKESCLGEKAETLGTTPRQVTDLLGSLCDLVSGSGDKGTPVVLIQGYFDDYSTEY
jgi:F420-0:gamma-glutamyl ligase